MLPFQQRLQDQHGSSNLQTMFKVKKVRGDTLAQQMGKGFGILAGALPLIRMPTPEPLELAQQGGQIQPAVRVLPPAGQNAPSWRLPGTAPSMAGGTRPRGSHTACPGSGPGESPRDRGGWRSGGVPRSRETSPRSRLRRKSSPSAMVGSVPPTRMVCTTFFTRGSFNRSARRSAGGSM